MPTRFPAGPVLVPLGELRVPWVTSTAEGQGARPWRSAPGLEPALDGAQVAWGVPLYRLRQGPCHLLGPFLAGGARLLSWVRQQMLGWGLVRSSLQMCLSKLTPRFGLGRKWEAPVRPPDLNYGFRTSFLQSTLHVGTSCQQCLSPM